MTALTDLPDVMTCAEAAAYLRVSKHSLYADIRAGRLRIIRVSDRVWRISRKALEDFCERGRENVS